MTAPTFFVCGNKTIASVTRGVVTTVFTFTDHEYHAGLIVRFFVPPNNGMAELDGLVSEITILSPASFSVPIDSSSFAPFIPVINPLIVSMVPQVIAIAENALTLDSAEINNNNILPEIEGPIPLTP
jgi:hypothetical protein